MQSTRTLAERALQLEPDLPEAHLASGFAHYYGDNNYDAALREFEIARRGLPNETEVDRAIGAIQRRQGKWTESTANLKKAVDLNPNDTWALQNLAFNYQMLRNFTAANKIMDRALEVDPKGLGLWEVKARLAIAEKGDLSVAETALATINSLPANSSEQKTEIAIARANILVLLRNYGELLQVADSLPDNPPHNVPSDFGGKYYVIGFAQQGLNDSVGAQTAFLKAKDVASAQLKRTPGDARIHAQSAKVLARLGEKMQRCLRRSVQGNCFQKTRMPLAGLKLRPPQRRFTQSLATTPTQSKFWRDC